MVVVRNGKLVAEAYMRNYQGRLQKGQTNDIKGLFVKMRIRLIYQVFVAEIL
jgi:hypothetical protein